MVKKLSPYEKAKKVFAQQNSVLHARIKEREEVIDSMAKEKKNLDDIIANQRDQIQRLMQNAINPPVIMNASMQQQKLKELESRVKSAMDWVERERSTVKVLRAQLLMATRAITAALKPVR